MGGYDDANGGIILDFISGSLYLVWKIWGGGFFPTQ